MSKNPAETTTAKAVPGEDTYLRLRDMILREQVLPNERLVETDYADLLKTNRANIRKALARLEQEGLVVIEPFKGAHVRRITEPEAIEMSEVRCVLETLLARHAAERANEEDRAEMRRLLAEARALLARNNPAEVGRATRRLRMAIWRISGHTTGQRILDTLNSQLVRIWFHAILMPGRAEEIVEHLDKVVEAVSANLPDAAAQAMRVYHEGSMTALKRAVRMTSAANGAEHLP